MEELTIAKNACPIMSFPSGWAAIFSSSLANSSASVASASTFRNTALASPADSGPTEAPTPFAAK